MSETEIRVPDLGDFKDVEVIDVLVKPGDRIALETPLITLETEKATLDVPASAAGVVKSITVRKGDRVSKGSVILSVDAEAVGEAAKPAAAEPAAAPSVDDKSFTETMVRDSSPVAAAPAAPPKAQAPAPLRAKVTCACEQRAIRFRSGRARCRRWRLHRGVPGRGSGHEGRADRALAATRRRVSQCRLYSFQGTAACREGHRTCRGDGKRRAQFRQAEDRRRQAARLEKQGRQSAHRRTRRSWRVNARWK